MVRISWPAIFIKAWGTISRRNPVLLQTWREWPWRHIFQHQKTVANLATSRRHEGQDWLFWGLIRSPESLSLSDIQDSIDRFTNEPPQSVFRKQLKLSCLPTVARRAIWWWNLNIAGEKRAKRLGTFSLTTVSGRGVEIQHPPTVMSTGLTFGPIEVNGMMKVTLTYDHRLMDGAFVAARLVDLEEELNGPALIELRDLAGSREASHESNVASRTAPTGDTKAA
ncbi:MAG: 2-oxo acid dehydrogenase subunit E2 [Planctomycetota bacterium]|nr:2-oxo acid dehydrogenase subunit E2 [Planctomycetota bacterium]MDA1164070.1 2-oxo acid dehydrogenase subunit E2 [Planctomycetota bacterium]